jgi:hypothetical protein
VPGPGKNFIQPCKGNVQYFAVNCCSQNRELPVVVAVGANYSQGPDTLPTSSPSGLIDADARFVEAKLTRWRKKLDNIFRLYSDERYPTKWCPAARPDPPIVTQSARRFQSPDPNHYHFVMTNFTPWITTTGWSKIRGTEAATLIMEHPPSAYWQIFLDELRRVLPPNTLWVGHGNYDVYDLWKQLVDHFCLEQWLFSSNLTFPPSWIKSRPACG